MLAVVLLGLVLIALLANAALLWLSCKLLSVRLDLPARPTEV